MIEITPAYLASQGLSPTFVERFWKKVKKTDTCWLWGSYINEDGYGRIWKSSHAPHWLLAHVASWILHRGPVPVGMCVLHDCPIRDNPGCVNPDHLWCGTRHENNTDRNEKGRSASMEGVENPVHKLIDEQVMEIRSIYETGTVSQLRLAQQFKVSEKTIFDIVHRLHWKHI